MYRANRRRVCWHLHSGALCLGARGGCGAGRGVPRGVLGRTVGARGTACGRSGHGSGVGTCGWCCRGGGSWHRAAAWHLGTRRAGGRKPSGGCGDGRGGRRGCSGGRPARRPPHRGRGRVCCAVCRLRRDGCGGAAGHHSPRRQRAASCWCRRFTLGPWSRLHGCITVSLDEFIPRPVRDEGPCLGGRHPAFRQGQAGKAEEDEGCPHLAAGPGRPAAQTGDGSLLPSRGTRGGRSGRTPGLGHLPRRGAAGWARGAGQARSGSAGGPSPGHGMLRAQVGRRQTLHSGNRCI